MVRNRSFYIEIRSIEKDGNTPTAHCRYSFTCFGFAKYSKYKYQRSFVQKCVQVRVFLLYAAIDTSAASNDVPAW